VLSLTFTSDSIHASASVSSVRFNHEIEVIDQSGLGWLPKRLAFFECPVILWLTPLYDAIILSTRSANPSDFLVLILCCL